MRTSNRARDVLSFIEVAVKIIDQQYRCAGRCGVYHYPRMLTQDHWVPRKNKGEDENHNIDMVCHDCNHSKGAQNGSEWLLKNMHWVPEETYGEEIAARNLYYRYIEHYSLKKRCRDILAGALEPHKLEAKYASRLLDWIENYEREHPDVASI